MIGFVLPRLNEATADESVDGFRHGRERHSGLSGELTQGRGTRGYSPQGAVLSEGQRHVEGAEDNHVQTTKSCRDHHQQFLVAIERRGTAEWKGFHCFWVRVMGQPLLRVPKYSCTRLLPVRRVVNNTRTSVVASPTTRRGVEPGMADLCRHG